MAATTADRPRTESPARALVTGAGSGIGRATALAFARAGAACVCADIDRDGGREDGGRLRGGRRAGAPRLRRRRRRPGRRRRRWPPRSQAEHGPLDVLVNNAGVGMTGRFTDMSVDDWAWIRGVNLDGVVNGCAAFGPPMLDRGRGHVVNVSSGLGVHARPPPSPPTSRRRRPCWPCPAACGPTGPATASASPPSARASSTRRSSTAPASCGDQADPAVRRRTTKLFRRGHRPSRWPRRSSRAVERNRAVVPGRVRGPGRLVAAPVPARAAPSRPWPRVGRDERPAPSSSASAPPPRSAAALRRADRRWAAAEDVAPTRGPRAARSASRWSSPPTTAPSWRHRRPATGPPRRALPLLDGQPDHVGARRPPPGRAPATRSSLYDQRGHGESTVGADGLTSSALGDDLRAVLEAVDARDAVLAGHSMGGMTIQALAAHHPEVRRRAGSGPSCSSPPRPGPRRGRRDATGRPHHRQSGPGAGHGQSRPATPSCGGGRRRASAASHLVLTRDLFLACPPRRAADLLAAMQAMDLRRGHRRHRRARRSSWSAAGTA